MSDVPLPEPRPVLHPLRRRDTARVTSHEDAVQTVVTIDHAPLPGVTAEMLEWWYGHVPGTMAYGGATYPRYQVWHPLDHISYEVVGGPASPVRRGTKLHIREALQRDPGQLVDIRVTVAELGPGRAVIGRRVLGTCVVQLENEFADGPDGATFRSRLAIGDDTLLGRLLLNRSAHRRAFPKRRIEPWIRHHIEEIGNLATFLPALYQAEGALK